MKKLAILGSTGSIGKNTLRIVQHLPELFRVTALAAHSNLELLTEQITHFSPEIVALYDSEKARQLQQRFPHLRVVTGDAGLEEVAGHDSVDFVVMALVGLRALKPTISAIEAGKTIGLATKEVLVSAGELIMRLVREKGVTFLPIDSEHSALFQCLEGRNLQDVKRVILTASGGPFYHYSPEQLAHVTLEEALDHPTWKMGPKVTVDSSTLVNKGLEMIEARWFFGLPPEKIEVVIHPQSLVHSFVEFVDGTLLAQMHELSMTYPIQYALTYPKREPGLFGSFDFLKERQLTFFPADRKKFPALRLAEDSMHAGGSAATYFNAANEVLVERFLRREISWKTIASRLDRLLEHHQMIPTDSLETILAIDYTAREEAKTA